MSEDLTSPSHTSGTSEVTSDPAGADPTNEALRGAHARSMSDPAMPDAAMPDAAMSGSSVDAEDPPGPMGSQRVGAYRWVIEWVIILMAVLICTVLLRSYVVQSFYIPSPSMTPTLQVGDRIMVNKLSYDLHAVHRGDVIVFKRPPLESQDYPDLVKRVIGMPGDQVSAMNGKVYINGKLLPEPWLPPGPQTYTGPLPGDANPQFNMPGPVSVPAGEYFVMGDNRVDSEDSRFFGPIPKSLIVGRAVAVVWPLSHAKGV